MSKLEKALDHLDEVNHISASDKDSGLSLRLLVVTLLYLAIMLSIPLPDLTRLLWFAVYPIVCAPLNRISFGSILKKSLFVLPVILLIGTFNPLLDHRPAFKIGNFVVSYGMVTFISLTLRGLYSVQAILIMIYACGFNNICYAMGRLGIPAFLTTQIMFVYRYIMVIVEESIVMNRARVSRGYGKKRMPLKLWGPFIGQLFIRSVARAEAVHRAMVSRGFNGVMRSRKKITVGSNDITAMIIWTLLFIVLRFFDYSIF